MKRLKVYQSGKCVVDVFYDSMVTVENGDLTRDLIIDESTNVTVSNNHVVVIEHDYHGELQK